jgi:uncharacterized membrane protein (DUF106 family)
MMMDILGVSLPLGAEMIIIVIGVVYTLSSVLLQRKLSNPKRTREVQAQIKQLTNELNALVKGNASKDQQAAKQSEVMKLMGESMRTSMKPMLVVMPVFLVVYYVMLPALPLGAGVGAKNVQTLFFYTVFALGLVSSMVILLYDKRMTKKEQQILKVEEGNLLKAEKGNLGLKAQS